MWSKFRSDENFANKESLTLKKLSPTKLVASSKWKHTGVLPDKSLAGLEELYSVDIQEQFTFNLKNRNVTAEVLESEVYLEGHYTKSARNERKQEKKPSHNHSSAPEADYKSKATTAQRQKQEKVSQERKQNIGVRTL